MLIARLGWYSMMVSMEQIVSLFSPQFNKS
jgi:hypothetical protein